MSWFWYKRRSDSPRRLTDWSAPLPDMAARDEWRLEALYSWERRLRGYDLFADTIALEPFFVPYDPTLDAETGGWAGVPQPRDARESEAPLCFLSLRLPVEQKVTPTQTLEFLSALRSQRSPLCLELIADGRSIHYQIACSPEDVNALAITLGHCFPLARLDVSGTGDEKSDEGPNDFLLSALAPLVELPVAQRVVDFGLYHSAYHPLKLFETFASDPHGPLIGALGSLQAGEVAGVQLLIEPAQGGWASSLALLVEQFAGVTGPAHPNTHDTSLERSLRYKLSSPLWAVALRVFAFTSDFDGHTDVETVSHEAPSQEVLSQRAFDLCRRIGSALDAYDGSQSGDNQTGNQLVALDDAGYASSDQLRDLLDRRTRRTGMLLSQTELAGLWHPPSERLNHPRLVRHDPRRRELPDYLKNVPGVALGLLAREENGFLDEAHDGNPQRDKPQIVRWPDAMRNRHLYMLGATRMGKSTLLLNLIAQDMLAGRGLCLIDPHGDLALDVLRRVPGEREADVFYLDLSDTAYPPALGLLEAANEWEKRLLVSDLLAILHRLFSSSWGDRLEHILRHALLTLLAADSSPFATPLTLRDIRPLLASKEYRKRLLEQVPDPDLHTFWASEFPGYTASAFAPVYNKLGLLLSSPVVRNIIGGSQTKLHAGELMQGRKILLVNLAQSLIGEDNAHFLGALLVSKIQLAAMHNLRLGREDRAPFTLYVDEFQNFVVSSFEKILSEAGKAGLTLVMANQFLEQLGEGLPTAIRSNAGTLISFRVSAQSGRALEGEFGGLYGAKELTDLERGQAVARLGRSADSFLINTFPPLEPATLGADLQAPGRIQQRTHDRLCRERSEVEAELRASDEALRRMLEEAAEAERSAKVERTAKPERSTKGSRQEKPIATPRSNVAVPNKSVKPSGMRPSAGTTNSEDDSQKLGFQEDDLQDRSVLDLEDAGSKNQAAEKAEPLSRSRLTSPSGRAQSPRGRRVRERTTPSHRTTQPRRQGETQASASLSVSLSASKDGALGEHRKPGRNEGEGATTESALTVVPAVDGTPAVEPVGLEGDREMSVEADGKQADHQPEAAQQPDEVALEAGPAAPFLFFGLPEPLSEPGTEEDKGAVIESKEEVGNGGSDQATHSD